FASLITVRLRCGKEVTTAVSGTIVGKREPRLVRVDKFELEAVPEGAILVMHNNDKPGVIGNVGRTLGEAQVNIAQFALARDRRLGAAGRQGARRLGRRDRGGWGRRVAEGAAPPPRGRGGVRRGPAQRRGLWGAGAGGRPAVARGAAAAQREDRPRAGEKGG